MRLHTNKITHTQVKHAHVGVLFTIQESVFLMQIIYCEQDIFIKTIRAK